MITFPGQFYLFLVFDKSFYHEFEFFLCCKQASYDNLLCYVLER